MGFNITGGHLAVIAFIVMAGLGMMWFEYVNFNPVSNDLQSDYAVCINSCSRLSGNNRITQCQIRCEALSECEESDKT